ncbi:MAG TPA: hypothetical protein VGO80_07900 [Solirubrobacteraceae bacterium]|nr:hypothetical protein [Solirubrobacteraceae bacterium]
MCPRGTPQPQLNAVVPATPAAPPASPPPPPPPPAAQPRSTLGVNQTLGPDEKLTSPNGAYNLVMQGSDGNLVLYQGAQALWNTGATGAGSRLIMQPDGNLVVYNGAAAKWASGTDGFDGAALALGDDAGLVVSQRGRAIWNRVTGYVADTLMPGAALEPGMYIRSLDGRYTLVMQSDGNLVLSSASAVLWAFNTSGHPGARAVMQGDGNFVVYDVAGTALAWTQTDGYPGAYLLIQDDANVVVYKGSTALWSRISGRIK